MSRLAHRLGAAHALVLALSWAAAQDLPVIESFTELRAGRDMPTLGQDLLGGSVTAVLGGSRALGYQSSAAWFGDVDGDWLVGGAAGADSNRGNLQLFRPVMADGALVRHEFVATCCVGLRAQNDTSQVFELPDSSGFGASVADVRSGTDFVWDLAVGATEDFSGGIGCVYFLKLNSTGGLRYFRRWGVRAVAVVEDGRLPLTRADDSDVPVGAAVLHRLGVVAARRELEVRLAAREREPRGRPHCERVLRRRADVVPAAPDCHVVAGVRVVGVGEPVRLLLDNIAGRRLLKRNARAHYSLLANGLDRLSDRHLADEVVGVFLRRHGVPTKPPRHGLLCEDGRLGLGG